MKKLIDIRKFKNAHYEIDILGLRRRMPLYSVGNNIWIVGNEHLSFGCEIEFTERVAKELAARLRKFMPQCLLTAEAKSLAITYEMAKHLGHNKYAIARKNLKKYSRGYIKTKIKSITAKEPQQLVIDDINIELIKNKDIVLIDDVISTGETMDGLRYLAQEAKANVVALAAVWVEGPWPFEKYRIEINSGKLVYLDVLPIFALGEKYNSLIKHKKRVEEYLSVD